MSIMNIFKPLRTMVAHWETVKEYNLLEEAAKLGLTVLNITVVPSKHENTLPSIQINVIRGNQTFFYMIHISPEVSYRIGDTVDPSKIIIRELALNESTREGHIFRAVF